MSFSFYCLEMPGKTKKVCPGCTEEIGVACKTCPLCKQAQPYKAKLVAKRKQFGEKAVEWAASINKNKNTTAVVDSSHMLVSLQGFYTGLNHSLQTNYVNLVKKT